MASELAVAVSRYVDAQGGGDGVFATPMEGLALLQSTQAALPSHATYRPALCVVVQGANVSSAAYEVGYESASQFSREYSRMFGAAPKRDTAELKGSFA
jgi:AraC-like DNA-binding protein